MKKFFTCLLLFTSIYLSAQAWGFYAHQHINKMAVFILPTEMIGFYKHHINYISSSAINPDKRRYIVKGEAPRHYIDLDVYGDSALQVVPQRWDDAVKKYSEDTLMAHGIVPWHIYKMKLRLTRAFQERNAKDILKYSAEIGHYIGDAHVPLHTTRNYNGQLTNQHGIHGFWESRLPELFAGSYNYMVGGASYIRDPQKAAWQAVASSHHALDSVLLFEKQLSAQFSEDKKYSFEQRGNTLIKVYSREYAQAYSNLLSGQVERRMRASIKMIGDFWFTCWVDGGQPDLNKLLRHKFTPEEWKEVEKEQQEWEKKKLNVRPHES
jgi:hypothetical protein